MNMPLGCRSKNQTDVRRYCRTRIACLKTKKVVHDPAENPPFILRETQDERGAIEIIGDFPFMPSLVESFQQNVNDA
jgi:hypothetical protein